MQEEFDFNFFRLNLSFLGLDVLQPAGLSIISPKEIYEVYEGMASKWYTSAGFPSRGNHYFFIGFSSKKRFLLVALSHSPDSIDVLDVHTVKVANEEEIRKFYYQIDY